MPLPSIFLSNLIVFFAFYIRAMTGFGGTLISVPLLALFFDLKLVVPLATLIEVISSLLLIKPVYKKINRLALVPLVIGALLGTLTGSYFLKSFTNILLKRTLGFIIILFALNMLRERGRKVKKLPNSAAYGAGFIGGTLGGMFGVNGPPIVMYLNYQLGEKDVLRATLIGLFTIDAFWRITVFTASGLVTSRVLELALILIPAFFVGTFLGNKTHAKISKIKFRKITSGLLILSGAMLLK